MNELQVLRFVLSGKTAFFKKPDVNTYGYFTYGNIHKVALLGMFGAILGYGGYNEQHTTNECFPEFYDKLKCLKTAILPLNQNGYIPKKMQVFNNSVGYASQEQGGNLIVKEQWLEEPSWQIYVLLDCNEAVKLANMILDNKCFYMPYLGKNDHPADISDAIILQCNESDEYEKIDSLFYREKVLFAEEDEYNFFNNENEEDIFKYEEYLPVGLTKELNMYQLEALVHTNAHIEKYSDSVYKADKRRIVFI